FLSDYSVKSGNKTVAEWQDLYKFLFTKYMDGNVKEKRAVPHGYKYYTPKVTQPGYSEEWNRVIVKSAGDKLKVIE
ncbi:MAG TPA: dipeptidase, partial [Bacteroidales bacterium]|nr:dipeptidase [Bacteroidales bacterium]